MPRGRSFGRTEQPSRNRVEATHVTVNGHANGWPLSDPGSTDKEKVSSSMTLWGQ